MSQQDAVDALDRQLKALELRKAGVGYDEIAKALGFKWRSGAFAAVKRALKEVKREPCQALITLEAERLDKMQTALWAKAIRGDYGAVDRILRIMERRARLLGLDAPERVDLKADVTGRVKVDDTYGVEQLRDIIRILADAGALDSGSVGQIAGDSQAKVDKVYTA